MFKHKTLGRIALLLLLTLCSIVASDFYLALSAPTNQECRTFEQTGRVLCGKFLKFWDMHGGLLVFGFPVSNSFDEASTPTQVGRTVQYFERAVLELHPENQPPYDVQPALLGAREFTKVYSGQEPGFPSYENLPLYPGSYNVKVIRGVVGKDKILNDTIFTAAAAPSSVFTFYKCILPKSGWIVYSDQYSNFIVFKDPSSTQRAENTLTLLVQAVSQYRSEVRLIYERVEPGSPPEVIP